MSFFDLVSIVLVGGGAARGWKRGAAGEVSRLVQLAMALLGGLGVFKLLGTGLSGLVGESGGAVSFLVPFIGVFVAVRKVKGLLRAWLETRLRAAPVWVGLLTGGGYGLAANLTLVVPMLLAPLESARGLASSSVIGGLLARLVGI